MFLFIVVMKSNSNLRYIHFLHSDWLAGKLYTSIKSTSNDLQFLPLKWCDVM